jgi:hypothetical protein
MKKSIDKVEQQYKLLKILNKLDKIQPPLVYQKYYNNIKNEAEYLLNQLNSTNTTNESFATDKRVQQYFKASLPPNLKLTVSDQYEQLESEKGHFIDTIVEGPFKTDENDYVLLLSATNMNFITSENRLILEKISEKTYNSIKNNC